MQRIISAPAAARESDRVGGRRLGIERDADREAMRARSGGYAGWIVGRLDVERDRVATGVRDLLEMMRRIVDHQVAVEDPARVVHRPGRSSEARPGRWSPVE